MLFTCTIVLQWKFLLWTQRGQARRTGQSLEQKKVCCRAMQGVGWLMPQRTPNSSKGVSKAILKARRGRGMVDSCKCLGVGILCSCSFPHISPFLQISNETNAILSSATFYLYMTGLLESWEYAILYILGYMLLSFIKDAKLAWLSSRKGLDRIWSQACS